MVSVIIPFMKGKGFLQECLESLVEQNYPDMEVILVKDKCEEDLTWINDEFSKFLQIHIIELESKHGVAAARNLGIDNARGEYIFFLDSDDYLYEDCIKNLVECAKLNKAQVVYGKKHGTFYKRAVFLPTFNEELEQKRIDIEAAIESENNKKRFFFFKKKNKDDDLESEDNEDADSDNDDSDNSDTDGNEDEETKLSEEEKELLEKKNKKAYKHLWSTKKKIKSISVLNILISKKLIDDNSIRFNEDLVYYSDVPFVLEILDKGENFERCVEARYIKRKHNDPINNPALSQIKDENRFNELINTYYFAKDLVEPHSDSRIKLDRKYIRYYAFYFSKNLKRSENNYWRNERFEVMHKLSKEFENETVKDLKHYSKRLIKALRKKDLELTMKIIKRRLARKKITRIFKKKNELLKLFYRHIFIKKPLLEDTIMCECFFGKSYGDNPKGLFEYIQKTYPDKFNFIWVLDKKQKIPYKAKQVKRYSFRYAYYLARSKYFIFNVRQPGWYVKRDGMIFLETWHGTPLKRLSFDVEEVFGASPKHKKQMFAARAKWDYLVAANKFSSDIFRSCFMYEGKMLEFGYPRNDILNSPNRDELAKKIRENLNVPLDKKVVLYAPTWREDEFYAPGQYKYTLKLDLDLMKKRLSKDYVVLVRTHYYVADEIDLTPYPGFALNVCKYPDIAELYLISDIIITDYSSVFFDYANLKRPMLFFTYDLEKYRDVLRGFYIDIEEELPGPLLFTTDEVIDSIENIDEINAKFKPKYDKFYEKYCSLEDGNASKNIVREVFKLE